MTASRRGRARLTRVGALGALVLAIALAGLAAVRLAAEDRNPLEAREVGREVGIYEVSLTRGASVHDFDRDGFDDLLVNRHFDGELILYRNVRGRRFEKVDVFVEQRDPHQCDWADVNQDGLPDFYCTVGGKRGGTGPNSNVLWMQERKGEFVNRIGVYGGRNRYGRGRDVTFIDANGDRFPDLYVSNAIPRRDNRRGANKLYINIRGKRFRDARKLDPRYSRVSRPLGGATVQAADYDADGSEDLLVCGKRRLFLFRNVRGRYFSNVSGRVGADRPCEDALLAPIDRDGRLDLVHITNRRLVVRLWEDGGFTNRVHNRRLTGGTDVAAGDVNRDRLPDLYIVQRREGSRDEPDLLLENRVPRGERPAFETRPIPQADRGSGDSATPIDYDRDGFTDFVVLNGRRSTPGPIRLIEFR